MNRKMRALANNAAARVRREGHRDPPRSGTLEPTGRSGLQQGRAIIHYQDSEGECQNAISEVVIDHDAQTWEAIPEKKARN